jgi:hypothetical protein
MTHTLILRHESYREFFAHKYGTPLLTFTWLCKNPISSSVIPAESRRSPELDPG